MMSSDAEFSSFSQVQFHSVFDLQQVWGERPASHLPLQTVALRRFENTLQHASSLVGANPLGLCFIGNAGAGKTHLLGEMRREAERHGANFVLSDLTDVRDFWPLLALHYLQSLQKSMNGVRQVQRVMDLLMKQLEGSDAIDIVAFSWLLPRQGLVELASELVTMLRPIYGEAIRKRQRVFRALLYLESKDLDLSERAYSFLQGIEQIDEVSQSILLAGTNSAKVVACDLAWFLSLSGPTVLAFDQLDPFVAQNQLGLPIETASPKQKEALQVLFQFTNGVMSIREEFPKTMTVLTCLETSWKVLRNRAVESFAGRFEEPEPLQAIRDAATPAELIGLRLDETYRKTNFAPPYRTWPFAPEFFTSMPPGLTPREILNRAEKHRLDCVRTGVVTELLSYSDSKVEKLAPPVSILDAKFARERLRIDPGKWLDETQEDALGELIAKAAHLLKHELPFNPDVDLAVEDDFQETRRYESLHVRLRRIFRIEEDREEHVCVRVLQKNQFYSFQVRLTAAMTTSGASEQLDGRRLVLLRNSPPPSGAKTAEMIQRARDLGAEFLPISSDDVRTMSAVVALSKANETMFETWLRNTAPLSKTALFRQLVPNWIDGTVAPPKPASTIKKDAPAVPAVGLPIKQIRLGFRIEAGAPNNPVYLPLVDLTRHVILRAGSGGGKTVFVKRLIEEAALCGIPSIVIDTAKDLSLLGDRWRHPPVSWSEEDAKLAEEYHKNVDVQIWTPGHSGGRSMRLAPLPNLGGPFAEPHDRDQVIEIAVSGLMPLAVQKKSSAVERAILKKVVEWLTRQPQSGGDDLNRLIAALRDLPGEAYQGYQNERRLAAGMADQIQAALVTDPLYGGNGADLDPAVLFGVGTNKTRISVLSLFALPDQESQARFIGQLSSLLFNWIRRNPAPVGLPARGLLVLDEAAPFLPRKNAESKPGLMLLARQARKYGLGLVLATQNPMDLDYNATANFSTQFFGTANTPQVVKHIQEAMEQKGLTGMNPGQLKTGEFFCSTDSLKRPIRLQGSMCLSAHPHNTQLSDDDILERAQRRN